jgi:hypothetical protein
MIRKTLRRISVSLAVASLLAVASCAAMHQHEAQNTATLLKAAGFTAEPADTPARRAQLDSLPALKMEARTRDGKPVYTYADPYSCMCLYTGGPAQYAAYKNLDKEVEAGEAKENAYFDWGKWGEKLQQ